MIYELLAVAIIVSLFRGGSLKRLQETEIRLQALIIGSFLAQVISMLFYHKVEQFQAAFPVVIISSYVALIYCCWYNRQLPGISLFGAGLFLNFLVIALNNGRMPVSIDALEWAGLSSYIGSLTEGATKHQPISDATFLPLLADVIPLKPPYVIRSSIISIGDLIMTLGMARFIYKRMERR